MSINCVMITGNLTHDPELRRTQSGLAIMGFGVAVNERVRDKSGEGYTDRANFIDCTMFGPRAESLSKILSKGMKVAVEGRLRWSQWDRDGQKRSKIEVIVDDVDLMSFRKDTPAEKDDAAGSGSNPAAEPQDHASSGSLDIAGVKFEEVPSELYEDIYDIPF